MIQTFQSWNLEASRIEPAAFAGQAVAARTWTTVYDAAGEPVADLQPGGVRVDRTFDPAGRVRTEVGTGAAGSRGFTYDVAGRLTSATSPTGTVNVTWNDRDQPLSVTGGSSNASYVYEAWGGVKSVTDAVGTSSRTYDAAGNVDTQTDPITGGTATFRWDGSNRASVSYLATPGQQVPYTIYGAYDDYGRLKSQSGFARPLNVDVHLAYGYDRDGMITSQEVSGPSTVVKEKGRQSYAYSTEYAKSSTKYSGRQRCLQCRSADQRQRRALFQWAPTRVVVSGRRASAEGRD